MNTKSEIIIRATNAKSDAAQMLEIYADSIANNIATFEEVPPTVDEFQKTIEAVLASHPWLTAEQDGQIIGYAYASHHRPRAGYRWTAEVSVYVKNGHRGKKIGDRLYGRLFPVLKMMGFKNLLAIISTPNPASEALHSKYGFEKVGSFENIGYKFGKWHETCWWQFQIAELQSNPSMPKLFEATMIE